MSGVTRTEGTFREIARLKLANPQIGAALDLSTSRLMEGRLVAWDALADTDEMRDRAHEARMRVIDDLDAHVARFREAVEARGGRTVVAGTAADANAYIVDVCKSAGAKLAAKSKSMATEEIGLNEALEAAGVRPVETDLGEYILQLAGEHPVHIIAPAIEKTKEDVAELLSEVDGRPVAPELAELTRAARRQLRETFHAADVGITGANFGVCDTGSIVLVTNEGNGRLVSTLPRVHVVAHRHGALGRLALRPRRVAAPARAKRHRPAAVDVYDADHRAAPRGRAGRARRAARGDPRQRPVEALRRPLSRRCSRASAAARASTSAPCTGRPAAQRTARSTRGRWARCSCRCWPGWSVPADLPHASSLCGACSDACPVKIPLHELLLELRRDLVEEGVAPWRERLAFRLWSYAWSSPAGYRLTTRLARLGGPFASLVGPGRAWAKGRTLPRLGRRFRDGR